MIDRSTNTVWIVILLGLCFVLSLRTFIGAAENVTTPGDQKCVWVEVQHESGTLYILRTSAIVGYVDPLPGDPRQRNGILLQGGHSLATKISPDEFKELVDE